jgi:hypothetical protein
MDNIGLTGADRPLIRGIYSNRTTRRLVAEGRVDGLVQVDTRVQGLIAVDLAVRHWLQDEPWPGPEVDPFTAYEIPLGRPWVITRDNVGDDPARLVPPGPDPVEFFRTQWQTQLAGR